VTQNLRVNLISILEDVYTEKQLREVISLCHALAIAFLRRKVVNKRVPMDFHGLNLTDLGYDCIADLFYRDFDGSLLQFQAYFRGISISSSSETELIGHLRRLVFSKVNNSIHRLFQEYDPQLGKIIRNIKLAVQALKNFEEIDRLGETYLRPVAIDPLRQLPVLEQEELQSMLYPYVSERHSIPEIMAAISLLLREQHDYCRDIHLVSTAIAIRSCFTPLSGTSNETRLAESGHSEEELAVIIHGRIDAAKERMRPKYVEKGKVLQDEFEAYFAAIEEAFLSSVSVHSFDNETLYDLLRKQLPSLSKGEYKRRHKNTLEYLRRQTGKQIAEAIRQ
jgi:hypothetical protein